MANLRTTVGAVFGTVSTTANVVTGLVNAAGEGINMLDSFVKKSSTEQRARHTADTEDFLDRLIMEKSMESAERNNSALEFCRKSTDHATFYQEAQERYTALLRPAQKGPKLSSVA